MHYKIETYSHVVIVIDFMGTVLNEPFVHSKHLQYNKVHKLIFCLICFICDYICILCSSLSGTPSFLCSSLSLSSWCLSHSAFCVIIVHINMVKPTPLLFVSLECLQHLFCWLTGVLNAVSIQCQINKPVVVVAGKGSSIGVKAMVEEAPATEGILPQATGGGQSYWWLALAIGLALSCSSSQKDSTTPAALWAALNHCIGRIAGTLRIWWGSSSYGASFCALLNCSSSLLWKPGLSDLSRIDLSLWQTLYLLVH